MNKTRKTRNDVTLETCARRTIRGPDAVGEWQLPSKNFISPVECPASSKLAPSITQTTQTLDKFGLQTQLCVQILIWKQWRPSSCLCQYYPNKLLIQLHYNLNQLAYVTSKILVHCTGHIDKFKSTHHGYHRLSTLTW